MFLKLHVNMLEKLIISLKILKPVDNMNYAIVLVYTDMVT